MSTQLQVLMPMGGLGSRFSKAGYPTPKLLIDVDGQPMFMRSLQSFEGKVDTHYIFVVRQEHIDKFKLDKHIREYLPDASIAVIDHDTRGAVETCLAAKGFIDDKLPISVADCDIYFESQVYFKKINELNTLGAPDGMLLTFPADDPRYSYVELDTNGKAVRTAEKIVISNHAILGGYFFKNGGLFKQLANDFLIKPLPENLKEYFMSHLFNLLLEQNGVIETADIDKMFIFGTPEELEAYLTSPKNERLV